jgi:hypothetical protein
MQAVLPNPNFWDNWAAEAKREASSFYVRELCQERCRRERNLARRQMNNPSLTEVLTRRARSVRVVPLASLEEEKQDSWEVALKAIPLFPDSRV